jgi:hypothetical protein
LFTGSVSFDVVLDDAVEVIDVEVFALGVAPSVTLTPTVVTVDPVSGGAATLTNHGDAPVELSELVIPTGFSVEGLEAGVIDPGDEVAFAVALTDAGASAAPLEIGLVGGHTVTIELRPPDCAAPVEVVDLDGDGFTACAGDCDDDDATLHPSARELADGIDQDCDDVVDDGTTAYDDDDDGASEDEGDCDDTNALVYPGSDEDLAGVDQDCDGDLDGVDADADGFSEGGGDCDDSDPSVRPGAPESANGTDDDCDTAVDEGTDRFDDDGDGVTEAAGDCDDTEASRNPAGTETKNGIDDDCDGSVDEGTDVFDDDGDGVTEVGGDCDDSNADIRPGVKEVAGDGIDQDCDGET